MKYKKNDMVIIKSHKLLVSQYGKELQCGAYYFGGGLRAELDKAEKAVKIHIVGSREYRIKTSLGHESSYITDEMILGHNFKVGEKIRVSSNGRFWLRKPFSHYDIKSGYAVTKDDMQFRYSRALPRKI